MVNSTIFSLTIKNHVLYSPLISNSYSRSLNSFGIFKSKFSKLASPIFQGISHEILAHFSESSFTHFLSSAIVVNSAQPTLSHENQVQNLRLTGSYSKCVIVNCRFEHVYTTDNSYDSWTGGALYVNVSGLLNITDTSFYDCTSTTHCGAVFSNTTSLSLNSLSFENCHSLFKHSIQAGWFECTKSNSISINCITVFNCGETSMINDESQATVQHCTLVFSLSKGQISNFNSSKNLLYKTYQSSGLELNIIDGTDQSPSIKNALFLNNTGSSIFSFFNSIENSIPELTSTNFINNTAEKASLWLFSIYEDTHYVLRNCNFENNTGSSVHLPQDSGTITLIDCQIQEPETFSYLNFSISFTAKIAPQTQNTFKSTDNQNDNLNVTTSPTSSKKKGPMKTIVIAICSIVGVIIIISVIQSVLKNKKNNVEKESSESSVEEIEPVVEEKEENDNIAKTPPIVTNFAVGSNSEIPSVSLNNPLCTIRPESDDDESMFDDF